MPKKPKNETPPIPNLVRSLIALDNYSGRELAILGYAWVDAALMLNLTEHFKHYAKTDPNPDIFSKALRNSDARIQVAEALGIITPRVRQQVDLLRDVRNEFAHSLEDLNSESPSIREKIGMMNLEEEEVVDYHLQEGTSEGLENVQLPPRNFTYDGRRWTEDEVHAFYMPHPWRVMFFVPRTTVRTRDDRLRRQLRMSIWAVTKGGLQAYINETLPIGFALLEGEKWGEPRPGVEVLGPDHGQYH